MIKYNVLISPVSVNPSSKHPNTRCLRSMPLEGAAHITNSLGEGAEHAVGPGSLFVYLVGMSSS